MPNPSVIHGSALGFQDADGNFVPVSADNPMPVTSAGGGGGGSPGGNTGDIQYNAGGGNFGGIAPTGTGAVVKASGATMTNPIVGTQTAGDNTTKAASTAFVQAALSGVVQVLQGQVATFADLPTAAAGNTGYNYLVRTSTGVYFINRKSAGIYTSDGAAWNFDGDSTEAYFQDTLAWANITSKPSTFAPSAHATSHVTGGADVIANAVAAGNSGLMTGADKTKLDGIEALADVTDAGNVGSSIHGATGKTTPVDADELGLIDSAASNVLKKVTWANVKATLKTYFDGIYSTFNGAYASLSGIPSTFAPSTHASSHASGGGDPVTLAQSQITNLTSDLAGKQSTITFGTGVQSALGVNVGTAGAPQLNNGSGSGLTALTAANISTGALANGMTATTQSAADNSTKLATTAYADAAAKAQVEKIAVFSVDGGGAAITTGTISGTARVPFACTLTGVSITATAATGTNTVKFWKHATATAIPVIGDVINTSGISLTTGTAVLVTSMSDFTGGVAPVFAAGDMVRCPITAVDGTATDMTVTLYGTRA